MIKLTSSSVDLEKATAILKNGGLAAFPTETVYGLGADAFNTQALAKVFEVKGRPRFDPLIIHITSFNTLERIAKLETLESRHMDLLDKCIYFFWPGPLTLVLPKRRELPDLATAGLPTAAIRFPSHPVARQLITFFDGAIAAPSANPFGRLSPTSAEHVIETLGDAIDCIIDGGPCTIGIESTVLELIPVPRILRPGGISHEQLENVLGPVAIDAKCDSAKSEGQFAAPSPGMLQSHYAPLISLFLHNPEEMAALAYQPNEAYLFFSGKHRDEWLKRATAGQLPDNNLPENVFALSKTGNSTEAAAHLFEYLHVLDKSGAGCIHAETAPVEGIGEAINDRLRRASVKRHYASS